MVNIAVAGTGYVGLVTGVCLANAGHRVTCVDIDRSKLERLSKGDPVIYEKGLGELMAANMERLTFTDDYASAYAEADAVFIAVGTPEKADGSANLKYVFAVCEQIAAAARGYTVVVLKSTVPIGTNDRVEAALRRDCAPDAEIDVVSNPEFLAQGTAVRDMLHPSRLVIGCETDRARELMLRIYGEHESMVLTNRRSAEMIKYASNDFLALKISFINEIANLCELIGADVDHVARGMGLDPRIGDKFLNAGIGYGGSCFPKDTKALHWLSSYHDYEIKTIKATIEVNALQKLKLLKKARRYYPSLEGLTVTVLGLTFKPGTDDLRCAPSLDNVAILVEEGADVRAWDPVGAEAFRSHFPDIAYCGTIDEALTGADLCFIFTEWPEIRAMEPERFLQMRCPIVLDGRNCFRPEVFRDMGITYDSIGRQPVVPGDR